MAQLKGKNGGRRVSTPELDKALLAIGRRHVAALLNDAHAAHVAAESYSHQRRARAALELAQKSGDPIALAAAEHDYAFSMTRLDTEADTAWRAANEKTAAVRKEWTRLVKLVKAGEL